MKKNAQINRLPARRSTRFFIGAPLIGVCLVACGGSSSSGDSSNLVSEDNTQQSSELMNDTEVDSSDIVPETMQMNTTVETGDTTSSNVSTENRVGLIVDSTQRCAIVQEPIELVIKRELLEGEQPEEAGELPNVTGFVEFTQIYGDSLDSISRTDESAIFSMNRDDVIGLIANVQNSVNGSVTAFLAAYDTSAPEDFIMRKPVAGGCLYAFKSADFCSTGLATVGSISFSRNGLSMSAVGCELQNPDNISLIELPADQ